MSTKSTSQNRLYLILFFVLAALWGGSFIAIKEVIHHIPPLQGAFFRVLIGLVTIYLISIIKKAPSLEVKQKFKSMFVGIFSIGLPFSLLFIGEKYISAGLAGVLNGTVPIWTVLIAIVFVSEERSRAGLKLVGALIGFVGILIISYPSLQAGAFDRLLGIGLILGMAISYAVGTNLSKMVMTRGGHPLKVSMNQHISTVILLFIVTSYFEGNPFTSIHLAPMSTLLSLAYLGIFSTGIAFSLFFYLMREWSATKISTVTFIIPIFSLLLDFLIYHSLPTTYDLAGAVVIFSSLFLVFKANKVV